MKSLIQISFLLILFFAANSSFAQPATGNIVVVTTMELKFHDDFSGRELDSLTQVYQDAVITDNEYILDYKILRHWWGHNNQDYVLIYTVKSIDDVNKSQDRINELFEEKWPNKEERDAFNKAYDNYFTGKHSDEIYREVKFGN